MPTNMSIAPSEAPVTLPGTSPAGFAPTATAPNIHGRGTAQSDIDIFNEQMRANPEYQALIATMGHDSKGQVSMSNQDRARVAQWLATKGVDINHGLKIDQAGNINQKNRLGKVAIAAAIAGGTLATAGALGAFSAPALAGGGAAAGGGAGAAGAAGGLGAATTLGGVGGTALAGLPTGLAGTTIAGSQLAGLGGALATGGGVAASALPGTSAGGVLAGGGTAATGSGRTGGSLLSKLINKDTIGDIGQGLGAVAGTQAHNRGTELDAMMEADKMKLDMAKDRRADETDLWKKLQAADYMKSGGTVPKPYITVSGRTIPRMDFGPAPISDANKAMASTLEDQLMERLKNVPKPSDYTSKMTPGKTESTLDWLSPVLSTVGGYYSRKK